MDQQDTKVKNLAVDGPQAALSKDQPPPYELQGVSKSLPQPLSVLDGQNATLGCIFIALSREQKLQSTKVAATTAAQSPPGLFGLPDPKRCVPETETRRIKNFLLFVLAVDYDLDIGIYLTTEVLQHFLTLGRWFLDLYHAHENGQLANEDVNRARPYLHSYVHAPTRNLKVPIDVLVSTTVRHLRSYERHGSYRSCTEEVLREGGLPRLAEKLHFDANVIAPLASTFPVAAFIWGRVNALARRYFSIVGPPNHQVLHLDMRLGMSNAARIQYTLNDGGREYEGKRRRKQTKRVWFAALRQCLS